MRWPIEGDDNSKFFNDLLKCKYANFNIKRVNVNEVWHDDHDENKQVVVEHFSSRFKETDISRPTINSSLFQKLSDLDACFLESNITVNEINEAVWGCTCSKAPGLDGSNFNLIKSY